MLSHYQIIKQSLFCSLGLASAALVLARDRLWKWMDAIDIVAAGDLQQVHNLNTTAMDQSAKWFGAWIELGMAWYLGFASVWLLSIALLGLSFKWPIPLLALPNISILALGIVVNGIAFGAILAWWLQLPGALRTRGYEQKVLICVGALFLAICALSLVFLALSISHYHKLVRYIRSHTRVTAIDASSVESSSPVRNDQSKMDVWNSARMAQGMAQP